MAHNPGEMLDLVIRDEKHVIYAGDKPMLTARGNEFQRSDPRLLHLIIAEIQLRTGEIPDNITLFKLFEFQEDYIGDGIDIISSHFREMAFKDDLITLKTRAKSGTSGHDTGFSTGSLNFEDPLFNTLFLGYSSMIRNLNTFIANNIRLVETDEDEEHPFILLLKQNYLQMTPEVRSAVHLLSFMHGSGIVLPVLFVTERITASEYALGRLALYLREQKGGEEAKPVDRYGFPYPQMNLSGASTREIYHTFYSGAVNTAEYLFLARNEPDRQEHLSEIITRGEGNELEFKSTFRWDLKAGKTNPAIERASLKTITAFLNSSGGILLIGIRDDGSVEGIESDRFPNEDKFLLHLWTLIRTSLGRDVSPYIHTRLERKEDKTVCVVRCSRSPKPIFLRQPGFNEEFYIRVGPSSNALDISEALRYISTHFE